MVKTPKSALLIVATDNETADYMERFVHLHATTQIRRATKAEDLAGICKAHIDKDISHVIIAASPELGNAQIEIATYASRAKVQAFVWGCSSNTNLDTESSDWSGHLTDALFLQSGAAVHNSMQILSCALVLSQSLGPLHPAIAVKLAGLPKELHRRIASGLENSACAHTSPKVSLKVAALDDGFTVSTNKKRCALKVDTATLTAALELLCNLPGSIDQISDDETEPAEPNAPDIEMFLAPPSRLLSETASKKLASYFGIESPLERLCHSATEAVRFSGELGGKVVVKLVRPTLEHKARAGAVITNIEGAPEVKRAVHRLSKLADELGPPEQLGYLVTPQIDGGLRLWIELRREEHFGPILVFGEGDSITHKPLGALSVVATKAQCAKVLERTLDVARAESDKMAATISRLTQAVRQLAPHLTRAEIHPLVSTSQMDTALALDVLFEITV